MRIDQLDVALRARSQWEAMELGNALVRRHAWAIWKPWLLVTLPLFALLNAGGWWLHNDWLPALLMWWLKPAFERIPLYVISRGAFGEQPGVGETLRAQLRWGWRGLWAHLLWRRLSPARSLLMPVDLLENGNARQRSVRRNVLGGAAYGHAALLTWMYWIFETMLLAAGFALILLFVPLERLPESARNLATMWFGKDTPQWLSLCYNLLTWGAMTLIGPFYSGAGFGLYLNRRTQLEAWDVEIAFRRLRERLSRAVPLAVLLAALVFAPLAMPARAQPVNGLAQPAQGNHKNVVPAGQTPEEVFGPARQADMAGFRQAAARVYEQPELGSSRMVCRWQPIASEKQPEIRNSRIGELIGGFNAALARLGEGVLWVVVGALLLALALTARWWLPWLRGTGRRPREKASPVTELTLQLPETLPPNVLARARALWREGKQRHALALLYRASLDELGKRANVALPPGSTEAQCLRASRRMPQEADRRLFARMVRVWQYAAYAGRLPSENDFQTLVDDLRGQYGWPA